MAGRNAQAKRGGQAAHGQGPGKKRVSIKLKKDDQVKVIAGRDKGKTGRVLSVDRIKGKVLVEGISMAKKHTKPNPSKQIKGGIAERESAIAVSNVMILTSGGVPSRVGYKTEGSGVSTRRVRVARKTGETLDRK
jgi:large subunit ribosomal protein L24